MRIGRIAFGPAPGVGAHALAIALHADKLRDKGGEPWFCGSCGRWFDHSQFEALGVSYEDHWNRCVSRIGNA